MKFYFALLGVLCAHALAQDENIKELRAAATPTNTPWNAAVLNTDLKSALFETCITAANTRQMQYISINDPAQEIQFVKYEVDRLEKGFGPVKWTREIKCTDILDCSRAAKDYAMFQYNGATCRMINTTFVDYGKEFCYDRTGYKKDVVYFNMNVSPSGCPANTDVIMSEDGPLCIGGTQLDVPFEPFFGFISCQYHYHGDPYNDNDLVNFNTIRNYMRNKKYQGEFLVGAFYYPYVEAYVWMGPSEFNDSYFAVKPQDPFYQQFVVISSSHDYLLIAKNNTNLITGFICIGLPF